MNRQEFLEYLAGILKAKYPGDYAGFEDHDGFSRFINIVFRHCTIGFLWEDNLGPDDITMLLNGIERNHRRLLAQNIE
jgi:hypothetical protein